MRCSAAVGCAGWLGGLTASVCARWPTGSGLTAIFAVGLALVRLDRRGGAFFAVSFLIVLGFLAVFLRLDGLATVVFLRFALALVFVAMGSLPDAHCIWKAFVRSLPNKKVSQQA